MNFVKALWNYYVVGTWYYFFPPKSENDPGDEQSAGKVYADGDEMFDDLNSSADIAEYGPPSQTRPSGGAKVEWGHAQDPET